MTWSQSHFRMPRRPTWLTKVWSIESFVAENLPAGKTNSFNFSKCHLIRPYQADPVPSAPPNRRCQRFGEILIPRLMN
jgi:hypothetical protein